MELLSATQAAARAGIATSTWRGYVARGQAPPPDTYEADRPRWHPATVDRWLAERPGRSGRPAA